MHSVLQSTQFFLGILNTSNNISILQCRVSMTMTDNVSQVHITIYVVLRAKINL